MSSWLFNLIALIFISWFEKTLDISVRQNIFLGCGIVLSGLILVEFSIDCDVETAVCFFIQVI